MAGYSNTQWKLSGSREQQAKRQIRHVKRLTGILWNTKLLFLILIILTYMYPQYKTYDD